MVWSAIMVEISPCVYGMAPKLQSRNFTNTHAASQLVASCQLLLHASVKVTVDAAWLTLNAVTEIAFALAECEAVRMLAVTEQMNSIFFIVFDVYPKDPFGDVCYLLSICFIIFYLPPLPPYPAVRTLVVL